MVKIYIQNNKNKRNKKENIKKIYIPIIITTYFNIIACYIYLKYIKKNTTNKLINTTFKHTNIIKKINCINIVNNVFSTIGLKNELYNKLLFIDKKKKYNNMYIKSNTYIYNINRSYVKSKTYYTYNNSINISIYNFKNNNILNKIINYYKIWYSLFIKNYKYSIIKGIYLNFKNIDYLKKTKDISTGLHCIEYIFENYNLNTSYIISEDISILNTTYYTYEQTSLTYIQEYFLFNLNIYNNYNLKNINKEKVDLYEKTSSILLPQYNIICKNISINTLLLNVYLNTLNYYTQEKAIYISNLYIFNLIVESLAKQYYKNNILIPSIQFEIIAKKMTSFVVIENNGNSSFKYKDILDYSILSLLNTNFNLLGYSQIIYSPIVLGISKSTLVYSGFFSSISFQEILKNIMNVSINSSIDWITDLKSSIITSDFIQVGSGWYRHFNIE